MTPSDKQKIADILERHGVVVGYLFGSIPGKSKKLFSADFAVMFAEDAPKEEYFRRELLLSVEIARALDCNHATICNLALTDPFLRHKILLGEGQPIYITSPEKKAELLPLALHEYEDALPS